MGIQNLLTFLKKKVPTAFETIGLEDIRFQKIAIDTSILMYKFKILYPKDFLTMFVKLIYTLRKHNIHPVFVFDGKQTVPLQKELTHTKRKNSRDNIKDKISTMEQELHTYMQTGEITETLKNIYDKLSKNNPVPLLSQHTIHEDTIRNEIAKLKKQIPNITMVDIANIKHILTMCKIPYIQSDGEAEKECVRLQKIQEVSGIISEDSDILAYGHSFISKFDMHNEKAIVIHYDKVLQGLDMTPESFLDMCIMFGTDYNKNLPGIGPVK